ncbi:MAG: ribosomal L7Ae/L30e/S12e/Gadd45 family protein [Thermoplasmatales archaeon]
MDHSWELARLKETGTYVLGEKVTRKMISKGKIVSVVVAREPHLTNRMEGVDVQKYTVPLNSSQLGNIFGKPFPVSVVGILDAGGSQFKGNE